MKIKRKDVCPVCNGDGWVAAHCNKCTDTMCVSDCPQQDQCDFCQGQGYFENEEEIKEI